MRFEILGEIRGIQTIAKGTGVKSRFALRKKYGAGNWRKMKGFARVRLADESEHQAEVHGMKHTGSAKETSKSKGSSTKAARLPSLTSPGLRFVVCVENGGYVDLEPLKIYRVKADRQAREHGLLRVVDSSGEDYLYPAEFFTPVKVTSKLFELVQQRS